MRDELASTHWREEFGDQDVETVWSIFKQDYQADRYVCSIKTG